MVIERKLFMHNMSHALCAYLGYLRDYEYVYQAVADYDIKYCALSALISSAEAVAKENGENVEMLLDHAKNLLYRFTNVALADTVARVGKDTKRKLGSNDRLIGALKLCEKHKIDASYICIGIAAGLLFSPQADESSKEVSDYAKENGVKAALDKYSDYSGKYVCEIERIYNELKSGKSLPVIIGGIDKETGKTIIV